MSKIGKILFFNEQQGNGFLITSDKEKINFSIQDWNDFDTMPALGLEVKFTLEENIATNIIVHRAKVADTKKDEEDEFEEYELEKYEDDFEDNQEENEVYLTPKIDKKENINKKKLLKKGIASSNNNAVKNISNTQQTVKITDTDENALDLLKNSHDYLEVLNKHIPLNKSIPNVLQEYFKVIQKNIRPRVGYKKVDGRLDYAIAKRFIWTTFNNLTEIDQDILTTRIKSITSDLKFMGNLYDDFMQKIHYPLSAFEEVFLYYQSDYKSIKKNTHDSIERLNLLRGTEKILAVQKKLKKAEIRASFEEAQTKKLMDQLKKINGTYSDVVHMMAALDERNKYNLMLLHNFEEEHKKDFFDNFKDGSALYRLNIEEILNAQAFLTDSLLWQEAKTSQSVKDYFKKSSIEGELNTKTYLKYYLSSLNDAKTNEGTKQLHELYHYLVATQKEYTLVITSDPQDSMDYESSIQNRNKDYYAKSFINELSAIKWAMKNCVKVLVVEDILQTTNATRFLNTYHNNIITKPKIILLGDEINDRAKEYKITKILQKNVSPNVVAKAVQEILNTKSANT